MITCRKPTALIAALAATALSACSGSSGGSSSDGDVASGDSSTSTGTLSFAATDAPVDDVTRVQVTFDRVELQPREGEEGDRISIDIEPPRTIDLLAQTGEDSAPLLQDTVVPAGEYSFVRLFVVGGINSPDGGEGSYVTERASGGNFDLFIPGQQPPASQPQRFLQLVTGRNELVVSADGDVDFTIDFELRKALIKPQNQSYYLLRPALRLINDSQSRTISGAVDSSLLNDASCTNDLANVMQDGGRGSSVYLYEGLNATPGDVYVNADGNEIGASNPVTAAAVKQNAEGDYQYTIGFIEPGEYTLAFTCQSLGDDPATAGDLTFVGSTNVQLDPGGRDRKIVDLTALIPAIAQKPD